MNNAVLPKEKTAKEMVAELPKLQPAPKPPKKKKVKAKVEKKSFFTYVDSSSEDEKSSSDSEEVQTVQLNSSKPSNASNDDKKVVDKKEKSPTKALNSPPANNNTNVVKPVETKPVTEEPKLVQKSFNFSFPTTLERKEEIVVQRKIKTLEDAGESEMPNRTDEDYNEDDDEMAESNDEENNEEEDDDSAEGDENNDDEEVDEQDAEEDNEGNGDEDEDDVQEDEDESNDDAAAEEKSAGQEELALAIDDDEVDKFVPKNTLEEIQDVFKKTSWGFDNATDIKSAAILVDPEEKKRTQAYYVHVQRTPEIIEQRYARSIFKLRNANWFVIGINCPLLWKSNALWKRLSRTTL